MSDGAILAKKCLLPTAGDEEIARFKKELRILSKLDHPNIIRVLDLQLSEQPYFCILPLYDESLRDVVEDVIGSDERIRPIFDAILDAVEYAHAEGIIHRDLKPENVLLNSEDDVVVSDFGLGLMVDTESTRLTRTGFAMGTIPYMPPEQLQDAKTADHRADIFALGRILYELYSGPIVSPVQDTSRLPSGVAMIVEKCTRPDPEERFQSVGDLKKAWRSLFAASARQAEEAELEELRARLTAPASLERRELGRFIELMGSRLEDDDLVHEVFMQLDPEAVAAIHDLEPQFTRRLVTRFAEMTGDTGWGFSYTDKIANQAKEVCRLVDDPIVRAELMVCLMSVGHSHNRWHVQGVFRELLHGVADPDLQLALEERLSDRDPYVRGRIGEWVVREKVPQGLRSLFDQSESDPDSSGFQS